MDGPAVALTPVEFRLLAALVRNQGQTLTPGKLLKLGRASSAEHQDAAG